MHVNPISSEAAADELVDDLFDPRRVDIVVVVSVSSKASLPYIDVDYLAAELDGSARIAVLESAAVAFRVTERLGDEGLSVYGGAGRIYPTGLRWVEDRSLSRVVFCFPGQGRRKADEIVSLVRMMSYRPGKAVAPLGQTGGVETIATVGGWMNESQILVNVKPRGQAKLVASTLFPGLEASRLVRKGQKFAGRFRSAGIALGDFFPDPVDDDPLARAREALPDGSVTLGLIDSVTTGSIRVMIHPLVGVEVTSTADDLTRFVSVGDVVPVELIWEDGQPIAGLSIADDMTSALSVLPGGPPWLSVVGYAPEPALISEVGEPPTDTEQGKIDLSPDEALRMIHDLTEQKDAVERELNRQKQEIGLLKRELREARSSYRPKVYSDDAEQLKFEILMSYLTRIPPAQRIEFPLQESYIFGRDFLESADRLVAAGGIRREKIVDVCADILCRRAELIAARAPRPWTDGEVGPQMVRADGARAWRINLQVNTASARRMRYWRATDNSVEFDFVGVHDERI